VLKDPLVPDQGRVRPREAPGAGLEWNEEVLQRYIVEA
jgi:L-alanine-DL-glutamate epimerase-like enolase superfamily enzyme